MITCTGQVPTSVTITITVMVIPCQVQENKRDVFRIGHSDLNSYKEEEIETNHVLFDLAARHISSSLHLHGDIGKRLGLQSKN